MFKDETSKNAIVFEGMHNMNKEASEPDTPLEKFSRSKKSTQQTPLEK